MKRIRKLIVAGLVVLLPLIATIYILIFVFNLMDGIFGQIIESIIGRPLPGVGILFTLLLILLTGFLATNIFGKKLLSSLEQMISRVPIMNSV